MWLPSIRSKKPTAPRVLLLLQICTNKMSNFEQNTKKKVVSLIPEGVSILNASFRGSRASEMSPAPPKTLDTQAG